MKSLNDLSKLINEVMNFENVMGSYDDRKLAEIEETKGLKISTCWTDDMGFETAIIDKVGVHPVERYQSRKEALDGHYKWIDFAKDLSNHFVLKLGYGELIEDKTIKLSREK